jgi:hypothetical protein
MRRNHPSLTGFALLELTFVLAILTLLVFTQARRLASDREQIYTTIDLANLRQILRGSALYSSDNNGHLPHPTWGSDLTGPDGWAYLTSNKDHDVPGATQNTPGACTGRDTDSPQFTNQLAFFKVGQVTRYLADVKAAWCPKDVATRSSGRLHQLWLDRPMKVTSYSWNGSIGGYVGPYAHELGGRTYKVSDFLPGDWQMWEQNENAGFYFNDAASGPRVQGETFSYRHAGVANWWTKFIIPRTSSGGATIGTFSGSGQYVKWPKLYDLTAEPQVYPSELLNGPGYRR